MCLGIVLPDRELVWVVFLGDRWLPICEFSHLLCRRSLNFKFFGSQSLL
ncbi:hypothetical protein CKA32_006105 [Geitlerinema sp. FC II]|nr:hypothetical protein CKA32_006105 [Geitlerinema sp. FC II]